MSLKTPEGTEKAERPKADGNVLLQSVLPSMTTQLTMTLLQESKVSGYETVMIHFQFE